MEALAYIGIIVVMGVIFFFIARYFANKLQTNDKLASEINNKLEMALPLLDEIINSNIPIYGMYEPRGHSSDIDREYDRKIDSENLDSAIAKSASEIPAFVEP